MLYEDKEQPDPLMLAIQAIIAINKVHCVLCRRKANAEEIRNALVLRAYYLGLEYPGCSIDPFSSSQHPLKEDLSRGFLLGTGAADVSVPSIAVVH